LKEKGSKIPPKSDLTTIKNLYFSQSCPKVDFWMHFGRPLAPFGLPFGSLFAAIWPTLDDLLAPIGSHLAPFGPLLLTSGIHFLAFESPGFIFGPFLVVSAKN